MTENPAPPTHLHLAVALTDAGWHPAAWREPDARPDELFTAGYWADLVREAEHGLLDFVTIEDSLGTQSDHHRLPDDRTDRVRGRLDAVLIAARVSPLTTRVGLVPTAVVSHTEPFHLSKAIATLDYVSSGRAGVRVQLSSRPHEIALFGRRTPADVDLADFDSPAVQAYVAEGFAETADYVEVLRRLWDSWEDDAEIRDAATGRFIDRDKLHYINFRGRWFDVKGPSITPRPPQGQPPVTALVHAPVGHGLLARNADIGYITPHTTDEARATVDAVRALAAAEGYGGRPPHIFGDLVVFLDDTADRARARRDRLDTVAGTAYTSDTQIFTGTPAQLADLLQDRHRAGLSGFRLRPATLPHDLTAITRGLVPELQRRGVFRTAYTARTLRGHLGLPRPANRYAAA
ncbi:LLM class flavin-dependent oxidoreductase [Yinghuangia sp. ASG 101]|uniref:LLM class flavin-dependent oxidoreductase n=1 Tax=Yinghuangia sp. ASG 101 TaxID=2896848 RepID=UPI001E291068|nr:LLM class flavin-dependent oxidoreductase [Yinghuangia sp. ASG 101]UGQ12544.1 LLM class flavin-dependent oxidoreductase [Yinghuangia sp. ASG 101]